MTIASMNRNDPQRHQDNNNDHDNDNEDNNSGDTNNNPGWINPPAGECGWKNWEGCLGWGKPEILTTAGITEDQYTIYMVSFLQLISLDIIDLAHFFNNCMCCMDYGIV